MQEDINNMSEEEIRNSWGMSNASLGRTILSASVGVLNSLLIFLWTFVYDFISHRAVLWENHKYTSDNESSYVTKSFIF